MSRLSAAIACFSLKRPVLAVAVIAITLLMTGLGLTRLGFDDGLEGVFAADTTEYRAFQDFSQRFSGTGNNVVVLLSAPDVLSASHIAALREFVLEAHLIEGVDAVFSLFSLQRLDPETGFIEPMLGQFGPDGPGDQATVTALLRQGQNPSYTGLTVLGPGLDETVVVLSLAPRMSNLAAAAPALRELDVLAGQVFSGTGLRASVTGLLPIRQHVVTQVQQDQQIINLLGAISGFLVSFAIFRSPWIAFFNGIAPVLALAASMGLIGLLGYDINVMNTSLPVLVMVLASSDCTHITYEICNYRRDGRTAPQAIERAMTELISPCALTSLTTMLAFASLYYSSSPIIRELSVTGVLSVGAALGAVLIVHPLVFAVASRLTPLGAALHRPLRADATTRWRKSLFGRLTHRRGPISLLAVILTFALLWAALPLRTSYSFAENTTADDPMMRTLTHVEGFSGPATAIAFPLEYQGNGDLVSPEVLSEVGRLHETTQRVRPDLTIVSLHTIARFLQAEGGAATPRAIGDILDVLPDHYLHRIISRDGKALLLSIMTPDTGSAQLRALGNEMHAALAAADTTLFRVGQPTDLLALSAEMSHDLILQLVTSFVIVALLCPLLIGLWFRRADFVALSFLPNVLPIVAMGAGLMVSGADIQFTSALALTIAFGIAVDDTVHVFNRLNLEARAGDGRLPPAAIVAAMTRVAPALVTTTLILSAGLIAVLWSDLPMIGYFGLLCIATFFLALAADLVILPALAAMMARRRVDRKGQHS